MQTFGLKNPALLNKLCAGLIILSCFGCAATPPIVDKSMNDTIISRFSMTNPLVQTMGRTESWADGSLRFAYPGVTIRFIVTGKAFWSYGMLTAAALEAQVNLVCYGGRGLVRSWNGRTDELNLPDYAELTIADPTSPVMWDHGNYTPDLILSAIGTNDFSQGIPDRENYVSTYVALIKRLLELHPRAHIVLTAGAILSGEKKAALTLYLTEVKQRIASSQLHLVPSNHYPGDACDAHPTKAQHEAMAKDLAPQLKRIMHW